MKIKPGVIMAGLQLEMRFALSFANSVYSKYGQELTITSALDGVHSASSYHYYGYALDLRTRFFDSEILDKVFSELSDYLSDYGFTVILETDHIHIHYAKRSNIYSRT